MSLQRIGQNLATEQTPQQRYSVCGLLIQSLWKLNFFLDHLTLDTCFSFQIVLSPLLSPLSWHMWPENKNESSERKCQSLSHVQLFAAPWTVAYQTPLSMEFSRQYYWNGLPFPSLEDLPDPDPGISPLISFQFVEEVKIQIPWSLHIFVWMISIM